jgi:hypothetical protein
LIFGCCLFLHQIKACQPTSIMTFITRSLACSMC